MNEKINDHLTEEQIMEFVLDKSNSEIQEHINCCPQCFQELQGIQEISTALKSIDCKEVPSFLERRIFHSIHNSRSNFRKVIESPYLITILALVIIFLLYLLIGTAIVEL